MFENRFAHIVSGMEIPAALAHAECPVAAVLLIPGSLFSDVDGDYPAWNMRPHLYRDLASQLATQGVSSLRFAKLGPGTGSRVVDPKAWEIAPRTFEQRLWIAEAFLDKLRSECVGLPFFLAGHSEGAVVATLLAQRCTGLSGVVLLSGPAKPLLRLMADQQFETDRRAGTVTAEKERWFAEMESVLSAFKAGEDMKSGIEANPYAAMLRNVLHPDAVPYMRTLEAVHPAEELRKVKLPVLIVQGESDTSVFPINADLLAAAQPSALVHRFPELQHFYKHVPDGLATSEHFGISSDSEPVVTEAIAVWIRATVSGVRRNSGH